MSPQLQMIEGQTPPHRSPAEPAGRRTQIPGRAPTGTFRRDRPTHLRDPFLRNLDIADTVEEIGVAGYLLGEVRIRRRHGGRKVGDRPSRALMELDGDLMSQHVPAPAVFDGLGMPANDIASALAYRPGRCRTLCSTGRCAN